jgi:WD40 repeat protein
MQHWGPIAGMAAHGPWVATAGYDNQVILWDGRTHGAVARGCHDHLVNHCAFSPDGQWLISASSDGSARLWSVPTMRLQAVLPEHDDDVDMAVFSPDGEMIATCALDRRVRLFDRQGQCLHDLPGHTGNVLSLAWRADGQQVVSSSVDGTLRAWDVRTGQAQWVKDLSVRTDSVAMTRDGTVYAGDDLGRIAILRHDETHYIEAHAAGIKKLVLDEDSQRLVTLSYDRSLAVWQLDAAGLPTLQARTSLPADIWARAATLQSDGRIAVGTFGGTYACFDPHAQRWQLDGVQAGPAINAICAAREGTLTIGDAGILRCDGHAVAEHHSLCNVLLEVGSRVLTGGQEGALRDAHTGETVHVHHSPLNCAATFVRAGQCHVAVGTYTGEVLIFAEQADHRLTLIDTLAIHSNAIKGLAVGETLLCVVCANTDISWHRLDTLAEVARQPRGHERIANGCCHLGDDVFATVSRDRQLRIWREGRAELHPSRHAHSVKCLATDDAHTTILTGSYGGTLALFEVTTRRWRPLSRPTSAGISSICWSPREQAYLAASYDGQVYRVQP